MRTLNYVVLFVLVLFVAFGSVGCDTAEETQAAFELLDALESWVTGCSGPISPVPPGRNGADVRGSYGLTMLRRVQSCRSGGQASTVWKRGRRVFRRRIRTRPSARPPGRCDAPPNRVRDPGPPGGGLPVAFPAARRRSPAVVAAGPASGWRRADRGRRGCGSAGVGPGSRAARVRAEAGAWFPRRHGESAPGDGAEHLQEPGVARTVDADRTDHHDLHAAGPAGGARQAFAFELRFLVHVPRSERRVFVGGRTLDVPVDAAGAAVHEAAHAGRAGRVEQRPRAPRVHGAVRLIRLARGAVRRGDVVHDVDAGARGRERRRIGQVAGHDVDSRGGRLRRSSPTGWTRQSADLVAAPHEEAGKMPSREPGDARDQDSHAASVSGAPAPPPADGRASSRS